MKGHIHSSATAPLGGHFKRMALSTLIATIASGTMPVQAGQWSIGIPWESTFSEAHAVASASIVTDELTTTPETMLPSPSTSVSLTEIQPVVTPLPATTLSFGLSQTHSFVFTPETQLLDLTLPSAAPQPNTADSLFELVDHKTQGDLTRYTLRAKSGYNSTIAVHPNRNQLQFQAINPPLTIDVPAPVAVVLPNTAGIVGAQQPADSSSVRTPSQQQQDRDFAAQLQTVVAAGDLASALGQAESYIAKHPEAAACRRLHLHLLLELQRFNEFDTALALQLQQQPNNDDLIRLQARSLLLQNQLPAARELLENQLAEHGPSADTQQMLAVIHLLSGQAHRARDLYTQLLRHDNTQGHWWAGLGLALEQLGYMETANIAFAQAEHSGQLNSELVARFISGRASQMANVRRFEDMGTPQVTKN